LVLQLDNFRRLNGYGWPKFKPLRLWRQDKGQKACAAAFVQALREGGPAPIPLEEILEVSRVTIDVAGEEGSKAVRQVGWEGLKSWSQRSCVVLLMRTSALMISATC